MNHVAIEFQSNLNDTWQMGYIKLPEDIHPSWVIGFKNYLIDKYKVTGNIEIYPLHKHRSYNNEIIRVDTYINMEDDLYLAIRSTKYYPRSEINDSIRRSISKLDPKSPDFVPKER